MLGSKFVKFLISILNWQVNSSSIFASFFIVMAHNSLVNFKLIYFLLWIKESHQSSNVETFKCSRENLLNSSLFSKAQVSFSSNFASLSSIIKDKSSVFFRSSITGKDQSKCKFLRLLSAWIKIYQILVIFETTNHFSFKFFILSAIKITPLFFLTWNIIYFGQKQPIKVHIFESFECLGVKFLVPVLN